jgi:hypothetical protein
MLGVKLRLGEAKAAASRKHEGICERAAPEGAGEELRKLENRQIQTDSEAITNRTAETRRF